MDSMNCSHSFQVLLVARSTGMIRGFVAMLAVSFLGFGSGHRGRVPALTRGLIPPDSSGSPVTPPSRSRRAVRLGKQELPGAPRDERPADQRHHAGAAGVAPAPARLMGAAVVLSPPRGRRRCRPAPG